MTSHLGEGASALVDGQLSLAEQEQALAHVATCAHCAQEVAVIRAARALLSGAGQVPAPRAELFTALASIAAQSPSSQTTAKSGTNPFLEHARLPGGELAGAVRPVRGRRLPVLAAAVTAGVLAVGVYTAGGPQSVRPDLSARAIAEHLGRVDITGDFVPVSGVGRITAAGLVRGVDDAKLNDWLAAHGWSSIEDLPTGIAIDRVGFSGPDRDTLEIVLVRDQDRIVLTQTHGQLDLDTVRDLPTLDAQGGRFYVAGVHPTHLVWQSGHNVLEVSAQDSSADLQATINEFKVSPATAGVSDRMVRGLSQIAGALP